MVLMFTDIAGSVKLKGEMGLPVYATLLAAHDALFREIVASFPGAEVRQDTGDGFLAAFATPGDAVAAGLRFQLGLRRDDASVAGLGVRIGIHLGQMAQLPPSTDGYNKLVGLGADLAARVMSLALPGQVLMTRAVFDDARLYVRALRADSAPDDSNDTIPQWLAHGRYQLKGEDEPVEVYEAGIAGMSPLRPPPDTEKARRFVGPDEEQTLGWRPAAGREIPGKAGWVIDHKLGEGGFGEVWLGRHAKLKTARVFKFCFDADRLRSLKREMTLFRLQRDALGDREDIARLHDVRLHTAPFFLESDYSPLGDLQSWSQTRGGIGKVSLETRLNLVERIADAVAAAHSVGILHKDIKPSNILIDEEKDGSPRPRLADFGIGVLTDRDRLAGLQITAAGFTQSMLTDNESSRTGTRMYAPPEMMAGKPFTTQGDVYALGVLLYQVVIGDLARPLAEGWQRDVDEEMLREDIAICIAGDPAQRLGSAAELAERLRTLPQRRAERKQERARRQREETTQRLARRRKVLLRAFATASLVLAAATVVVLMLKRDADRQRAEADGQRNRAVTAEAAMAVEAENARSGERKAKSMLARMALNAFVAEDEKGDIPRAFLHAIHALQLEDSAANRQRVALYRRVLPRLYVAQPGTEFPAGLERDISYSPDRTLHLRFNRGSSTAEVWDTITCQNVGEPARHAQGINQASFDRKGVKFVTASDDGTARVWHALTGNPVTPPLQHGGPVYDAAFSPDGLRVITASDDRTARIWDAATGRPITPPLEHETVVWSASFSPDGSRAVLCGERSARVLDTITGQAVAPPLMHDESMHARFCPDGASIVTRCMNKVRVWDSATGRLLSGPFDADALGGSLEISADSSRLLIINGDRASVRQIRSGQLIDSFSASAPIHTATSRPATPLRPDDKIWRVAFSEKGDQAVLTIGNVAWLWKVASDTLPIALRHDGRIWHTAFSGDGARVVTSSTDGTARVWSSTTGEPLASPLWHPGGVYDAAFSADGTGLLTSSLGAARFWDMSGDKAVAVPPSHDDIVNRLSFRSDGLYAVTSGREGLVGIWDAATKQRITPPIRHGKAAWDAEFSPDGARVVTASWDGTARVWDVATGQALTPPLQGNQAVDHAEFSPDGARLVTADVGGAQTWSAVTGQPDAPPLPHQRSARHATFSKDGNRIATASHDHTARVWDALTGAPVTPPLQHENMVNRCAFSHSGTQVVTVSYDYTARVWDTATGKPGIPPLRHASIVWDAAFSQDDTRIVTGSADSTARVWNAVTGQPLTPPLKHSKGVRRVAFTPGADRVITAAEDQTVRVWDAVSGQPVSPPLRHERWLQLGPVSVDTTSILALDADPLDVDLLPDVAMHGELVASARLDESGTFVRLTGDEWRSRWTALTARHPDWFLPPPTLSVFEAEMARTPADSARLKRYGLWFHERREHGWAAQLLERARAAGAEVSPLTLARSCWLAGRYAVAKDEFAKAIASESDAKRRAYLQDCMSAVEREATRVKAPSHSPPPRAP